MGQDIADQTHHHASPDKRHRVQANCPERLQLGKVPKKTGKNTAGWQMVNPQTGRNCAILSYGIIY
jgi:hypothetical protein